ncbi:MAG: Crp/Fnr family transcriptional regulator [Alphaproteobacteria bacterium]|nr:Crp/Fnr family transcriptional regulator [Alphaproteobacteria bacterium]MCB9695462.1 Crp/Fnr family transcriptional regulator [Alphaproteobacteria bacterium]
MTDTARPEQLARHAFFAELRPEALARLAPRVTTDKLRARVSVWSPGDPIRELLLVRSGVLREAIEGSGDRDLCLRFLGRGDLAGDSDVLASLSGVAAHHTHLSIHEEASVWRVPLADLREVIAADPRVLVRFGAAAASALREVEQRLAGQVFHTVEARIAAVLQRLAERFGVRDSRGVIVNLKLTHRDLAALAGSSRESASVVLTAWRRAGLVAAEGRRVVVLDREGLSALAGSVVESADSRSTPPTVTRRSSDTIAGPSGRPEHGRRRRRPPPLYSRA